jgi:putative NADH-flavin reductase
MRAASRRERTLLTLAVLFCLYAIALAAALAKAGYRSHPVRLTAKTRPLPARVLIIGATGGTGRHLVTGALERGCNVTALVRNPSKLEITHPRLTVIQGNVLDEASVHTAMRGQDAVLCALGHKQFLGPTRILSAGTGNILRAMESQGVERLVCETSLGIGDSAGRMGLYYTFFVVPVILPFYYWDKTRQERLIENTDLEWVIVRPGVLTNAAARGHLEHGHRIGSLIFTVRISRADVAEFMLDQLGSDQYLRQAPGVAW